MSIFTSIALAALTGIQTADAVSNELTLERSWQGAHDDDWALLSDNPRLGTWGVRGGMGLTERLGVVASYHRGARGSTIRMEDPDTYEVLSEFNLALKAQQIGVGVKYDLDISPWIRPYGTVQGTAMFGRLLMDDDVGEDDNSNQLSYRGFGPGGFVGLGAEAYGTQPGKRVRFVGSLEVGYSHTFPMTFTADSDETASAVEVGKLGFNGLTVRLGTGIRF